MAKATDVAKLAELMRGMVERNPTARLITKSAFLDVPLEIRLKIYDYTFNDSIAYWGKVQSTNTHTFAWPPDSEDSFDKTVPRHQLLLTCRRCYEEGRQLYYTMTMWKVGDYFVHVPRPLMKRGMADRNRQGFAMAVLQRSRLSFSQATNMQIGWIRILRLSDFTQLGLLVAVGSLDVIMPALRALIVDHRCDIYGRWSHVDPAGWTDNEYFEFFLQQLLSRPADYVAVQQRTIANPLRKFSVSIILRFSVCLAWNDDEMRCLMKFDTRSIERNYICP